MNWKAQIYLWQNCFISQKCISSNIIDGLTVVLTVIFFLRHLCTFFIIAVSHYQHQCVFPFSISLQVLIFLRVCFFLIVLLRGGETPHCGLGKHFP